MLKFALPIAILPSLLMAQPAEARRLFWWQTVDPNVPGTTIYDSATGPDDPGAGPAEFYDGPDARFNEEQYMLYRREMAQHYHRPYWQQAEYPPIPPDTMDEPVDAGPQGLPVTPYVAPVYPVKPKAKAAISMTDPASTTDTADPVTPAAPPAKPKKPKATAAAKEKAKPQPVSCDKGATIVSGFGFEKVTTKSCDGATFSYAAERGGKPFQVDVNSATGELLAVKKL